MNESMNENVNEKKADWPEWVNKWRSAIQQCRSRQAAEAAALADAMDEAIAEAGGRASAAYQLLKSLDNRPLADGLVLRVREPRPEYGEGRVVKLMVGGMPIIKLTFGFVPTTHGLPDVGKHFVNNDEMTCFGRWVTSSGQPWAAGESRKYCERSLADFLLSACG